MKKYETELYFEAHVTIEPLTHHVQRMRVIDLGKSLGFRLATFLLKKDDDTPDDFLSTRSQSYEDIEMRVVELVKYLPYYNCVVKRYKIENTLLDVKFPKDTSVTVTAE